MYIKGFDENLRCRDYQFEIGKEYDTGYADDELELCSNTVFHFCKTLQEVHEHYNANPKENNRFCEIEVLGGLVEDDHKCGSNKIKIVREITGTELAHLRGLERGNSGLFNTGNCNTGYRNTGNCNTGNRNTGHCNTGNRNTGNWNTGNRNTGNCNTGYRNTGNCNTGYRNTGNCNTGHCNTGHCNTGNRNTGHCNTGNWNTGNRNTGHCNTGNCNTGNWNKCDRSTGLFNTKERTITIFNKDSELTWEEIVYTDWYRMLRKYNLVLTEWIYYTDEEKKDSPIRQCIGGYLKRYDFKEACANWWSKYTLSEKYVIMTIPNFDKDIFKEITGIEV